MTWNTVLETGGILVGDEVTITLDVEFVKASRKAVRNMLFHLLQ